MAIYKTGLVPNVNIVGSPSIEDNIATGFSTSNYLTSLHSITALVFELRLKIKTSATTITGGQKILAIGSQSSELKALALFMNSAGTNIYAKHYSDTNIFTEYITNDTFYYIKFISDGTTLSIYGSNTGYDSMTLWGSTPLSDSGIMGTVYLGCEPYYSGKGAFGGKIYLEETQLYINNTLWWNAVKTGYIEIKSLYKGNTKIKKLYKGSTLVYSSGYPSGTVLFENATAGTYTLNVLYDSTIIVDLVGGGSGACYGINQSNRVKGGSGAYISGTTTITAGTYTVVVGAGSAGVTAVRDTVSAGGNSTFNGNTAGGAGSWTPYRGNSTGGTASVSSSGLSGQNGSGQNSTGWISGYGAGGNNTNNQAATIKGKDGYCKITVA